MLSKYLSLGGCSSLWWHNGVIVVLWDEKHVVIIETNQGKLRPRREERDRDIASETGADAHMRREVEIPTAELPSLWQSQLGNLQDREKIGINGVRFVE